MAAKRQQGSCRNIAGICAEGNGLDYISGAADASSCDKGYAVADALVPQPLEMCIRDRCTTGACIWRISCWI